MRYLVIALAALAMTGCANKIHISCPDCTITNDNFVCTGCSVEAQASKFDGDILEILPPIIKPKE